MSCHSLEMSLILPLSSCMRKGLQRKPSLSSPLASVFPCHLSLSHTVELLCAGEWLTNDTTGSTLRFTRITSESCGPLSCRGAGLSSHTLYSVRTTVVDMSLWRHRPNTLAFLHLLPLTLNKHRLKWADHVIFRSCKHRLSLCLPADYNWLKVTSKCVHYNMNPESCRHTRTFTCFIPQFHMVHFVYLTCESWRLVNLRCGFVT